jgi:protein O-mannosyl-transferase
MRGTHQRTRGWHSELESGKHPTVRRYTTPVTIAAFLALLALIAYSGVVGGEFIELDTCSAIVRNPHIQQGFSWRSIRWSLTDLDFYDYWHPLTWLTHIFDFAIYGMNAGGHKLTNAILHMANVVLLFLVLNSCTGALFRSAAVAALFAVHPVHVESVAWVVERKDVLSGLSWFLTLLLYIRYRRAPSPMRMGLVLVSYAVGLSAKPMLVMLPPAMVLLDYWPLGLSDRMWPPHRWFARLPPSLRPVAQSMANKVPLFALALLSVLLTVQVVAAQRGIVSLDAFPLSGRLALTASSYLTYIGKLVFPVDLAVFYAFEPPEIAHAIGSTVVIVALSILALIVRKRRPYVFVGWAWFMVTLLPVVGLVKVGSQSVADRFLYLPAIGLYIAAVWTIAELVGRSTARRTAVAVATAIVLAVLLTATRRYVSIWRTNESLFTQALNVSPHNCPIHNNLGFVLVRKGAYQRALYHFLEAARMCPGSADAYVNAGEVYAHLDRTKQAEAFFKRAIDLAPNRADVHIALADLYMHEGHEERARALYLRAASAKGVRAAYLGLAGAGLHNLGDLESAERVLRRAITMNPHAWGLHNDLGLILLERGAVGEALRSFVEAQKAEPTAWQPYNNAGTAFLRLGNTRAAAANYQAAHQLSPESPQPLKGLQAVQDRDE